MANVKPEYLLDAADYRRWRNLQRKGTSGEEAQPPGRLSTRELRREALKYEAVSRWSWTDLLCQLAKVKVTRVTCPAREEHVGGTCLHVVLLVWYN